MKTREELSALVRSAVTEHMARFRREVPEVTEASKWVGGGLPLDSLDFVDITMEIEERLDVELDDAKVADLVTVGDFVDYVADILGLAKAAA